MNTLFFDFYALYYLLYKLTNKNINEYKNFVINDLKFRKISNKFEKICFYLSQEMINAIYNESLKELNNITNINYYSPLQLEQFIKNTKWKNKFAKINAKDKEELQQVYNINLIYCNLNDLQFNEKNIFKYVIKEEFSIDELILFFSEQIWKSFSKQHRNIYGGELWSKILTFGKALEQSYNDYDIEKMVYYIDRIYDLEHNSGKILNKPSFKNLKVSQKELDLRANFKSLKQFENYCSNEVKQLINDNYQLFETKLTIFQFLRLV